MIRRGVLAINDGYRIRNVELGPVGIPFVRGGDIRNGGIETTVKDHIRPEFTDRVQSKLTLPFDVAFITKGTVGRVGIVRPYQPQSVFAPQVCYWRSLDFDKLEPRFLFYLLTSVEFQANLDAVKTHGSMAADYVSMKDQRNFRLTFPPIREQKAIAAVLGALDNKIELNRRMNATLEAMARALFQSWFVDFDPVRAKLDGRDVVGMDAEMAKLFPEQMEDSELGHIPKGWKAATIGEGFSLTMGQSPPGSTYNKEGTGLPFYQGRTDFGFRFPTRRVYCSAPTRYAKPGDTLVSVRAPVGDINMASEDCCIGRGVAAVRHGSGATSFTYYSMANLNLDFARFEAEGTVFGSINKNSFEKLRFVVPPTEIVAAYEHQARPLDEKVRILEDQSCTLATIRDTLLPKLLSGELPVASL